MSYTTRTMGNFVSYLSTNYIAKGETVAEHKAAQALKQYEEMSFWGLQATRRWTLLLWSVRLQILRKVKRVLDIAIATVALILAFPLMLVTAIAIKLESPGPIIFHQTRVGKMGKPFTFYKFRSMCIDAEQRKKDLMAQNEASGPVFKMQYDPRMTRVGRIIRKLSIDELPQFINVLRGDMSIVGPRPPVLSEVAEYELEYLRRLDTLPGITGLQQISGRSNLEFDRWIELDLDYVSHHSIGRDLMIVLKTIPAVLLGKGAY